jgi:hypothetical protein
MKTESLNFILFAAAFSSFGLALFIYFGNSVLEALRRFDAPKTQNYEKKAEPLRRRKTVWKPTITCSLPLYQEKRAEAPFFLK